MKNACSAARRVGKTGSDRSTRKIATVAGGHRRELAGSLVGAILVAGCYSSSPSTDSPVPNVVDSQVLGSWQTACTSLDGVTSTRATNEFLADGRIEITTTAHRDAACVLPSFDLVRSGTYLEHTEVSLPDGGVQVSLDQVFDQNSVRPRNEESTGFFNSTRACGFTDWEVGVVLDIGRCVNDPGQPFTGIEVPFETYDIARQDRGRLFFGNEVSFTAWNRPVTLKTTVGLIRASGADGDEFPEGFIGFWRDPSLLFEGSPVSMRHVFLGARGQITFINAIPGEPCLGDVTLSLFDTGVADTYRDAFDQLRLTIVLEGDRLQVSPVGVAQVNTFERETNLVVGDLPLCRPVP